jgi:H+/Cl- antiporter ClcA
MPTELLTRDEQGVSPPLPPARVPVEEAELRAVARQIRRVHRLKIKVAAWAVGTILITVLWVLHEWQANGAFERFAHEGNQGDWNPTLPALAIGIWGLVVGIGALRVRFERPPTAAEVDREVERLKPHTPAKTSPAERRHLARERLERIGQLRFHVAAWVLGMIVIAPLNALVEWQDNGGFQRLSSNSQPGSWDPWVLYIGGTWALVIAIYALWVYVARRAKEAKIERGAYRPHSAA